jgi:hypothetical protein
MQLELNLATHETKLVETEEWRQVPDFGYEVSSFGRVRNCKTGRYLNGTIAENGYVHMGLLPLAGGPQKMWLLHRLVALVFLEQPSPKHNHVNHRNKDRADNRLANLEWMTPSENMLHAFAMKREAQAEKAGQRADLFLS